MACLDEIAAALQRLADVQCCADQTFEFDPTGEDTGVWPVEGPGPDVLPIPDNDTGAGSGEYPITPATDPDEGGTVTAAEWDQYVCGAANFLVDTLIDWLRYTRFAITLQRDAIRVIQWLVARIVGRLIPGIVDDFALYELDDYQGMLFEIIPNLQVEVIDTAIAQLEGARNDINCAAMGENTAQNAINAVLALISGSIDDGLVLAMIANPVGIIASLIWNGALDVSWSSDCDCEGPTLTWTFDTDFEGWTVFNGTWTWRGDVGNPVLGALRCSGGPGGNGNVRSPNFVISTTGSVLWSYQVRKAGGTQTGTVIRLRRASDNVVERSTSQTIVTSSWQTRSGTWTAVPAGTYYLEKQQGGTIDCDTISITRPA